MKAQLPKWKLNQADNQADRLWITKGTSLESIVQSGQVQMISNENQPKSISLIYLQPCF